MFCRWNGILSAMGKQAYIFDMDGVLVGNCRYHVLAWRVFSRKHGFELTDEQVLEWMGAANRDDYFRPQKMSR